MNHVELIFLINENGRRSHPFSTTFFISIIYDSEFISPPSLCGGNEYAEQPTMSVPSLFTITLRDSAKPGSVLSEIVISISYIYAKYSSLVNNSAFLPPCLLPKESELMVGASLLSLEMKLDKLRLIYFFLFLRKTTK